MTGEIIRLEPLEMRHIPALVAASEKDRDLYHWSPVPNGHAETTKWVETAICWRKAATAEPYVTVRIADGAVIGSTRFWNIERWLWPPGHERFGRKEPDACEIGHTWLSSDAIRSGANTETKYLMLQLAFETWSVLRVCFHTDDRNARSRAALERIGGRYEGILRAHRMAADFTARNSARYSILASEWPAVKKRLMGLLRRATS